uniref:Uncharacterized protein n=1 Tax=Oryza glumipatula TaxID=40148 RepID=A0A0D9YYS9_9ORYZ
MMKLRMVFSRAAVVGVRDGGSTSGGELRHACACRAPACFDMCFYGVPGCSLEVVCAPAELERRRQAEELSGGDGWRRLAPVFGLPRKGGRQLKTYLRMPHVRIIAPKLTRERGIEGISRQPEMRKASSIFKTAATSLAQWLGQRSTGWMGTAMRRKAALWTPGATTSSTQVFDLCHIETQEHG